MPRTVMTNGRSKRKNKKRIVSEAKSGAKEALRTKRALEFLDLRLQGWTLDQIGQSQTPPITRERVRVIIEEYNARCVVEKVEHYREYELRRYDQLQTGFYEKAVNGDHFALQSVLSISDRRSKLLGLAAPVRSEFSGPNGGPIETKELSARDRIASRISSMASRARTSDDTGGTEPTGS